MRMLRRGWLEPGRTDPELGLRAQIADPVWFLARQWELGEFEGEDAAAPVRVRLTPEHLPLRYDPARPDLDPTVVPGEALVEAEPDDWWTIGRRCRIGKALTADLPPGVAEGFRFGALPAPYQSLADRVDGLAVFRAGILPGHPAFAGVPAGLDDRFSPTQFSYSADLTAGGSLLQVVDHRGGDLDWFSVSAPAAPAPAPANPPENVRQVIPTRLTFPGAPHPRWWQIEDVAVDLGAFAPDRSHVATMLLADLAVAHAEDWFVFPVSGTGAPGSPTSGVVTRLGSEVIVTDSFGVDHALQPPPDSGPGAWALFAVPGLAATDLVIWPVAVAPHGGPVLDDVVIGVDEDANLAWAVELRADGRDLLADERSDQAAVETTRTGTRNFRYQPMTTLPPHWYPYLRHPDAWSQAVLADLNGTVPEPRPGPDSRLIGGPSGEGQGGGHRISPTRLPSSGLRVQRRTMLARDTDARPVLWVERRVLPASGPPVSHLRWDVLVEETG